MAVEQKTIDPMTLSDLVPIKSLSPDHCQELANKSELVTLPQGRFLFKSGDPSERIIYLLAGQVELQNDKGESRVIVGGSKASKLPLEQAKVYRASALAKTEVTFIKVDPNLLDIMLTWEQSGGYEVQELAGSEGISVEEDDWMSRILQAKVFHKIPPANIQSIFMKMEAMHFKAGESVIKQGEDGDRFYILREGKCKVIRKTRQKPEGVVLAVLGAGDNFGEEALISGGKRNASVVMATDGVLMSLTKADFLELMNEPILQRLNYNEAKQITGEGGVWIDVRLPSEFQARHLPNSINIPLPLLRNKLDKLDADRQYIVCCDTGRRSSTATYLLTQNNFNAYVLENGLQGVPNEALQN
ncbi:cyclic nucleotide-binding domain-containing protein [Kaarinaea lacus]